MFAKFTSAPEAATLFSALGVEPWGRYSVAILELIGVMLILIPWTVPAGSVYAIGFGAGAMLTHILPTGVGIEFNDDGGTMFTMAVVLFVASTVTAALRRKQIPLIGAMFRSES
ncbi:MAG: DoxX family protein [Planctomycetota bacterium]|nr:DoxX family protein [Planctomycetota bacterium]